MNLARIERQNRKRESNARRRRRELQAEKNDPMFHAKKAEKARKAAEKAVKQAAERAAVQANSAFKQIRPTGPQPPGSRDTMSSGKPNFAMLDVDTLRKYKEFYRLNCEDEKSKLVMAVYRHFNTLMLDEAKVLSKFADDLKRRKAAR